jgi:hypothetical protein
MAKATRILIAAPGRLVHQEDGQPWPAKGLDDPNTLYTRRRLRDGDLIEAKAADKTTAKATNIEMEK